MALFFLGLGSLIKTSILLLNAIVILSEDRFLAQIGLTANLDPGFGGRPDASSVKVKINNLIHSVRTVMKYPLIALNSVIILYELVLG